ncbi:hypothetical protein LTS08_005969 [Lithohypha guttulata]|uniref:uncharacterized protein n=1 Tax=Lithohypha guttulata TaxID=1690604 RepID=UPI002DDED683|nr:hypothetical protein LTR51_002483 [Lithohypha guttulata]KAK5099387.1 hypothetical protein LTS08_005969 [Lithohypha guttulata]
MPRAPPPGFYVLSAIALFIWFIIWTRDHATNQPMRGLNSISDPLKLNNQRPDSTVVAAEPLIETASSTSPTSADVHGAAIAPKLGNETAKAELGRAAWKLFHTTMARFPENPTTEESAALKDYIHLFARLYPCGECASHFQQILKKYPPQVGSRNAAAQWACFVHNEVNVSKGKEIFDCKDIGDWYNCGCAEEGEDDKKDTLKDHEDLKVEIEREGLMNGG